MRLYIHKAPDIELAWIHASLVFDVAIMSGVNLLRFRLLMTIDWSRCTISTNTAHYLTVFRLVINMLDRKQESTQ